MKYNYEDMKRLRFTNKLMDEFIEAVEFKIGTKIDRRYLPERPVEDLSNNEYESLMMWLLEKLYANDYRNRPEYLLADTNRDRAIAAMKGGTTKCRDNVLAFWKKFADKMTDFEKVMLGWYKI